jgi:spore coat protein U-like protein
MKKFLSLSAFALLALSSLVATQSQAATATGTFLVGINLTSACVYAKTADVAFSYTSFQVGAATATAGGFTLQCTNSLPYTLALDATSVTDLATNLAYTVALSAVSGTGSGVAQSYSVTGSMAAAQAGTCATAGGACTNSASTNKTRTLTITY